MQKKTLRQVMKRAHELAKKMIGDYAARLALALKIAWKEVKEMAEKMIGTPKQVAWAKDIRDRAIQLIEEEIKNEEWYIPQLRNDEEHILKEVKENIRKLTRAKERIMNEKRAKWFIENRWRLDDHWDILDLAGLPTGLGIKVW